MPWGVLLFLVFFALALFMLSGLPIAFSLGLLGIIAILIYWPQGITAVGMSAMDAGKTFELIAVPLFIFMGSIIVFSGFSRDFYDTVQKWTRALPGSLAITTTVMSACFAALTGSSTANTAAIGTIAMPEMLKRQYHKPLATGTVAAGGALGILIPPSIGMILYGTMAQVSISKLFMAGIIPGIVMVAIFCFYIAVQCLRHPDWAPKEPPASWSERLKSLWRVWGLVFLIMLVLGSIYLGVATPTEAAGIGAFGAIILGLAYRAMNWSNLRKAFLETINLTSMVMFIVVGGMLFSKVLVTMGLAQQLTTFVSGLPVNRWIIMIGINIMFIILGCMIDPATLILVFTPLMMPILRALAFDPIWFGVVFTINIEIANLSPPVGYNLFVMKAVAPEVSFGEVVRGVIPFIIMFMVGIALLMLFPQLALWLPATM